jgi:hypothetical protein
MEETFFRSSERRREKRTLPAATYNLAHTLLHQSSTGCVFVPIRSMQYMAVIDREEFIFVDREGARMIEISWQKFDPHQRTSLDDPVPYEAVYYGEKAEETMKRLQGEFHKALESLAGKRTFGEPARVIKLERRG